jgi:hypothetical protein
MLDVQYRDIPKWQAPKYFSHAVKGKSIGQADCGEPLVVCMRTLHQMHKIKA